MKWRSDGAGLGAVVWNGQEWKASVCVNNQMNYDRMNGVNLLCGIEVEASLIMASAARSKI